MCGGFDQPSKSARWSVLRNAWFILSWLWFTVCGFKSHSERWGRMNSHDSSVRFHQRTPKRSSRAHLLTLTLSVSNLTKCPAELIVSSVQPFMGDNYCDAINNRAFCNYDGGDCCQSTVKTKKVSGAAQGGSCWICSDLLLLFAPRPWSWEKTPPRTFSLCPLPDTHPSGVAIFFEPWCVNDCLNLRGFSAVRWNHNWVYCWRQLDFISWNISKGILQFFAFSPVLNYLDRLPIRHPRQWVLLSFINTLCFPTVFNFLMCHASTLGPLCLQLLTNQKVIEFFVNISALRWAWQKKSAEMADSNAFALGRSSHPAVGRAVLESWHQHLAGSWKSAEGDFEIPIWVH